MRTTIDLADDVLMAVKDLAKRQRRSAGAVISELTRLGLQTLQHRDLASGTSPGVAEPDALYGFVPLPARGKIVSNAVVDALRDELGV